MNEIIKGIYIQTVENKKLIQKYVPTEELELANGETLGEFLNAQNERIEKLKQDLEEYKIKAEKLELIFSKTIRGFITK
jgi:hypothetical protein